MFSFFPDHEVMDSNFHNMLWKNYMLWIYLFFQFCQNNFWHHSSKCTCSNLNACEFIKVWTYDFVEAQQGLKYQTTSKLYYQRRKSLNLLCVAWNCIGKSNFNICFLFQNLFKCYNWKHDLKAYSIIYILNNMIYKYWM